MKIPLFFVLLSISLATDIKILELLTLGFTKLLWFKGLGKDPTLFGSIPSTQLLLWISQTTLGETALAHIKLSSIYILCLFHCWTKSLFEELILMFSNVKHIFSWLMFFHGQNCVNDNSLILCCSYLVMRTFPWQMFLDFLKQIGKAQINTYFYFFIFYFPQSCYKKRLKFTTFAEID
jgi:hypothetical protein